MLGATQSIIETFTDYSKRPVSAEIVTFMATPQVVPELAYHGQSALVLERLERMSGYGHALVLSAPGAVQSLAQRGHGEKLVALIAEASSEQQTKILSTPGATYALAFNGQGDKLMNLIDKLRPEQQAAVLAAPDAMLGLCISHPDKKVLVARAAKIMGWVDAMPAAAQEKVLTARHNVGTLAFKGVAQRLVNRVGAMEILQQEKILSDAENANGLAVNGQKDEVTRLQTRIKEWRAAPVAKPT